jgi:hypothetical protein
MSKVVHISGNLYQVTDVMGSSVCVKKQGNYHALPRDITSDDYRALANWMDSQKKDATSN